MHNASYTCLPISEMKFVSRKNLPFSERKRYISTERKKDTPKYSNHKGFNAKLSKNTSRFKAKERKEQ